MKQFYASCILGISCLCLCAANEVTTEFDFSVGPESGIKLPHGMEWPLSGSVLVDNETMVIGDISIRFDKNAKRTPAIYKVSDEDCWNCRFYQDNKLTIISNEYNILKLKAELMSDTSGSTPGISVITGQKDDVTYSEEPPSFTWKGNMSAVTIQATKTMYILKLEVTTDGGASAETDLMDDGDEMRAQYYTLQGVKVENPSGGIFVRISDGKATKVVIP